MRFLKKAFLGLFCGLMNGLFGSGGGVVAVPMLSSYGLPQKESHATSVAVIFFLSLISTLSYWFAGNLDIASAVEYIPYGVVGAIVGAFLLKKVPNDLLRRIFGIIVLLGAVRILLK